MEQLRPQFHSLLIPFLEQYITFFIINNNIILCSRWLKGCYRINFFNIHFQVSFDWWWSVVLPCKSLCWTTQRKPLSYREVSYRNPGSTQDSVFHRRILLETNFHSHDAPGLLIFCTLEVHHGTYLLTHHLCTSGGDSAELGKMTYFEIFILILCPYFSQYVLVQNKVSIKLSTFFLQKSFLFVLQDKLVILSAKISNTISKKNQPQIKDAKTCCMYENGILFATWLNQRESHKKNARHFTAKF